MSIDQIIIGMFAIAVSIVSAALSHYFSIKLKIKSNQRDYKEKTYLSLIDAISRSMVSNEKTILMK